MQPYPESVKTFPSRRSAFAWGRALEAELKRKAAPAEFVAAARLTTGTLIAEFLDDPAVRALAYPADLAMLAWWETHARAIAT